MTTSICPPSVLVANDGAPAEAVLVIENEEYIAHLLKIVFTRAGFGFRWARTGAEAARLLATNSVRVSLALVDDGLADVSGGELGRELRVNHPGLPLLLTSGNRLEPDEELGASGPTLFVAKPFVPSRLVEQVRSLLDTAVAA
jgi:DNA-binding response OmpR family regulator